MKKFITNASKVEDFSGVVGYGVEGVIEETYVKGLRQRGEELPIEPDTSFGIASGTKGFTALLVLKLIDEGKLSLEDKVFELLPQPFPNMDKRVTVRQLLSHTSGIYDYFDEEILEDFSTMFEKVSIQKIHGPADMYPLLIEGAQKSEPGEKFRYCNGGFVILAMLVESVSGEAYEDYLNEVLLQPLGLKHTGCYSSNQLPANVAIGYEKDGDAWEANTFDIPIKCTGDGGLYTCIEDMTKVWIALIEGDLLSEGLRDEALSVQGVRDGNSCYGLGFFIMLGDGGKAVTYSLIGEDPGVSFFSRYNVEDGAILVVLSNTSFGAWDMMGVLTEKYIE